MRAENIWGGAHPGGTPRNSCRFCSKMPFCSQNRKPKNEHCGCIYCIPKSRNEKYFIITLKSCKDFVSLKKFESFFNFSIIFGDRVWHFLSQSTAKGLSKGLERRNFQKDLKSWLLECPKAPLWKHYTNYGNAKYCYPPTCMEWCEAFFSNFFQMSISL